MVKLAAALLTLALLLTAAPAQARDRRPCVTAGEYRQVQRHQTWAQVRGILDGPGRQLIARHGGYWQGTWVLDGYWDDAGYWSNTTGLWVPVWVWMDTTHWRARARWVPLTDVVRTWRKCHGHGRVAVNLDSYSSPRAGLRVHSKLRRNPWLYPALLAAKPRPHAVVPREPASAPSTPHP